jgi:hypothetical protein
MKNLILKFSLIILVFASCSTESVNSPEQDIAVNLETFVPDAKFDLASEGKYIGIFGHHTNREMHGKIYVNAGQHNQFGALVKLVNGSILKYKASPTIDLSSILYKGVNGSFLADLSDFENPIITDVKINGEPTDGYIIVKKATRGAIPYVRLGTYVDELDPGFYGNWDLMGDGIVFPLTTPFGPTNAQLISLMTISHGASSLPFTDTSFEPIPPLPCLDVIGGTTPVPSPFISEVPLFGGLATIAQLQTSTINGFVASWRLAHVTDNPFFPGGVYYDAACEPVPNGTWTWNGRSGSITVVEAPL